MTVEEIWFAAKQKGYDQLLGSQGKTPEATLGAQLYVSVRDKQDSPFVKLGSRPSAFFLKSLMKGREAALLAKFDQQVVAPEKKSSFLEKDLHPFLAYYAYYFLRAHTKTINHAKSEKKSFGEWVHPDMVGCYFPVDEWKPEVLQFSATVGSTPARLFSFEIKRDLNFGNLREAFFQAVSNSSWSHEGYLVAAEISADEEFRAELQRLSGAFGIGVIHLNLTDPDSTETIFPARPRAVLDWDTINKLTMNTDFKDFLKRVNTDISSKEIRKEKYDPVLESDQLQKRAKGFQSKL